MQELKTKVVANPFKGSMLVIPNDGKPHPGLVTLHGSEGGSHPTWKISAMRWASEGYAVLAYSYFGADDGFFGPRQTLADIEVENVVKACEWLKASEFVQGRKVGLEGTSRGAELALLTGTLLGKESEAEVITTLSVHSPASCIWGPWNNDWVDERCWIDAVPSFEEILAKSDSYSWNSKCGPDPRHLPAHLQYSWKWKGHPLQTRERIEVEHIKCPVFLSQGMSDSLWPAQQAKDIERTLQEHNRAHEAVFYENEDHWLSLDAAYDRQKRLLAFLRKHLG